MDEKQLFRIAVICAFIGIIGVIIASQLIEVKTISIEEAKEASEGDYVKITGNAVKIDEREKVRFINVKDETGEIKVVIFRNSKRIIAKDKIPEDISNGMGLQVEGRISEYNGETELLAEQIETISF